MWVYLSETNNNLNMKTTRIIILAIAAAAAASCSMEEAFPGVYYDMVAGNMAYEDGSDIDRKSVV